MVFTSYTNKMGWTEIFFVITRLYLEAVKLVVMTRVKIIRPPEKHPSDDNGRNWHGNLLACSVVSNNRK